MTSLKKGLIILAVGFAMGTTANIAQANCGSCGTEKPHKHKAGEKHGEKVKKVACVKCAHGKVCTAEDCKDKAHNAKCTCPAKKEKKKDKAA